MKQGQLSERKYLNFFGVSLPVVQVGRGLIAEAL